MTYAIWSYRKDRPNEIKEFPDEYIEAPGLIEAYLIYIKNNIPKEKQKEYLNITLSLYQKAIPSIIFTRGNYKYSITLSYDQGFLDLQRYINFIQKNIKKTWQV